MADSTAPPRGDGGGYDGAVSALLSPLHQSTTPSALRAAAARRKRSLADMDVYLRRLGLDVNGTRSTPAPHGDASDGASGNGAKKRHIPPLIIHVTGTKGKGSTLSLCESMLRRAYGLNTGMFTSPHLVSIRERIRINGVPVSKEVFGEVYWRVRRKLEDCQSGTGGEGEATVEGTGEYATEDALPPLPTLPGYFRMLTLMALYAFCHYEHPTLDVLLLEVGMGGRYDATNVLEAVHPTQPRMLVRGVTLIDYDHTRVLGSTLGQIAWEKGGIFVQNKLETIGMDDGGYDAFLAGCEDVRGQTQEQNNRGGDDAVFASGSNTSEVLDVLGRIANDSGCHLQVVSDPRTESFREVGLQGKHQRSNAALALAMCQHAVGRWQGSKSSTSASPEKLQDAIDGALAAAFWPGRCHTVPLPLSSEGTDEDHRGRELSMNLRCDGAHTPISINACIGWYRMVSTYSSSEYDEVRRVLVFNCSHERNPIPLLYRLYHSDLFASVYFCSADFERPSALPKRLEEGWTKEPLVHSNEKLTLENMCNSIGSVPDPSKLSASTWQETLANIWRVFEKLDIGHSSIRSEAKVASGLKVKDALAAISKEAMADTSISRGDKKRVLTEVCVTGSLYIVGSALEAAGWEEEEAPGRICN